LAVGNIRCAMAVNMDLDIVVQQLWPEFANKTGLNTNGSYAIFYDDKNIQKLLEEFRKGLSIYKTPSSGTLQFLLWFCRIKI
jgi:hypothetical protein